VLLINPFNSLKIYASKRRCYTVHYKVIIWAGKHIVNCQFRKKERFSIKGCKKSRPSIRRGSFDCCLQFYNVLSLWSTVAFYHVELNALAFFEGFEAFTLDSAEVNEYVV
jgi:hypothetical protein